MRHDRKAYADVFPQRTIRQLMTALDINHASRVAPETLLPDGETRNRTARGNLK